MENLVDFITLMNKRINSIGPSCSDLNVSLSPHRGDVGTNAYSDVTSTQLPASDTIVCHRATRGETKQCGSMPSFIQYHQGSLGSLWGPSYLNLQRLRHKNAECEGLRALRSTTHQSIRYFPSYSHFYHSGLTLTIFDKSLSTHLPSDWRSGLVFFSPLNSAGVSQENGVAESSS